MIGFLGTAWLVVVLVILKYLLVFDPSHNPFQHQNTTEATQDHIWTPNYIDQWILSYSNFLNGRLFRPLKENPVYTWLTQQPASGLAKAFDQVRWWQKNTARLTWLPIYLNSGVRLKC